MNITWYVWAQNGRLLWFHNVAHVKPDRIQIAMIAAIEKSI